MMIIKMVLLLLLVLLLLPPDGQAQGRVEEVVSLLFLKISMIILGHGIIHLALWVLWFLMFHHSFKVCLHH